MTDQGSKNFDKQISAIIKHYGRQTSPSYDEKSYNVPKGFYLPDGTFFKIQAHQN